MKGINELEAKVNVSVNAGFNCVYSGKDQHNGTEKR
jgi:hypothetical protein